MLIIAIMLPLLTLYECISKKLLSFIQQHYYTLSAKGYFLPLESNPQPLNHRLLPIYTAVKLMHVWFKLSGQSEHHKHHIPAPANSPTVLFPCRGISCLVVDFHSLVQLIPSVFICSCAGCMVTFPS